MKLLLSYNASVRRSPKRRAYSVTTSECDRFGVFSLPCWSGLSQLTKVSFNAALAANAVVYQPLSLRRSTTGSAVCLPRHRRYTRMVDRHRRRPTARCRSFLRRCRQRPRLLWLLRCFALLRGIWRRNTGLDLTRFCFLGNLILLYCTKTLFVFSSPHRISQIFLICPCVSFPCPSLLKHIFSFLHSR